MYSAVQAHATPSKCCATFYFLAVWLATPAIWALIACGDAPAASFRRRRAREHAEGIGWDSSALRKG